ncbi:hypothetical protein [Methylorubrum thiocyanatum]|uniref:hypothetical protein n=1 Tax=Methylorubrum thiocyanatum TaxID=47958 RepID=UPI00398C7487
MASIIRVVVPVDSMDPESWKLAIEYACAAATGSTPPAREIVLLTHTKAQLEGTSLSAYLGEPTAKALLSNSSVTVSGGTAMRHVTMRTAGRSLPASVVIAFHANDELLEFVDGLQGPLAIVAVPDLPDDAVRWIERWTPHIHGQPAQTAAPLIADPVVEKALEHLTSMGSGKPVLDPRDEERVNETLRILRAKDHVLVPEKIESWAIRNGWKPKAAEQLAHKARKIGGLASKPSLRAFHNPEGKYAGWQP